MITFAHAVGWFYVLFTLLIGVPMYWFWAGIKHNRGIVTVSDALINTILACIFISAWLILLLQP